MNGPTFHVVLDPELPASLFEQSRKAAAELTRLLGEVYRDGTDAIPKYLCDLWITPVFNERSKQLLLNVSLQDAHGMNVSVSDVHFRIDPQGRVAITLVGTAEDLARSIFAPVQRLVQEKGKQQSLTLLPFPV